MDLRGRLESRNDVDIELMHEILKKNKFKKVYKEGNHGLSTLNRYRMMS